MECKAAGQKAMNDEAPFTLLSFIALTLGRRQDCFESH